MNNNGLRFELGELAIFRVARAVAGIPLIGTQCTVVAVGPFKQGANITISNGVVGVAPCDGDYMMDFGPAAIPGAVLDWQLKKINPPEEPLAMQHNKEKEKLADFM